MEGGEGGGRRERQEERGGRREEREERGGRKEEGGEKRERWEGKREESKHKKCEAVQEGSVQKTYVPYLTWKANAISRS